MTVGMIREVDTETVRNKGVLARERIMFLKLKRLKKRDLINLSTRPIIFSPRYNFDGLAICDSHNLVVSDFSAVAEAACTDHPVFRYAQLPTYSDGKKNAEFIRS
jgi:hypothetical protein